MAVFYKSPNQEAKFAVNDKFTRQTITNLSTIMYVMPMEVILPEEKEMLT